MDIIEQHKQVQAQLDTALTVLKDISIPLDQRWDRYTELVQSGAFNRNDPYGDGEIDTLGTNMTLYDDFYIERGETTNFIDMYERVMEAEEEYDEVLFAAQANITKWQEAVLASGYSSFTYDW